MASLVSTEIISPCETFDLTKWACKAPSIGTFATYPPFPSRRFKSSRRGTAFPSKDVPPAPCSPDPLLLIQLGTFQEVF